jgi:predicted anti-sigma-YlaC factor YlaD
MLDIRSAAHIHEDDLELYLRGRLESERAMSVEQHLLECDTCREGLSVCLGHQIVLHRLQGKSESPQKRSEPRFIAEGEAILQEIHPLSLDRQKVQIVNISKNGLGILSPKAILPGTVVQLRIKNHVELGNVRYCSALREDGFRLGLRLHDEDSEG